MRAHYGKKLAITLGGLCSLTATFALAGAWTGRETIGRITVRADQTISIVSHSGTWPNPDACDNASRIILLPPGAPGAILSFEQVYALLLQAHASRRPVMVFVEGCTLFGDETFPILEEAAFLY